MTKYIDNINCALHLCDTENEEWSVQIANYGLSPLVVINEILATRNKEKITQKLLLQLCKESEPNISYTVKISGEDDIDIKSFVRAVHKDIIGLWEDFSKTTFNLLRQGLSLCDFKIDVYKNIGHQYSIPVYVLGDKLFNYETNQIKNHLAVMDELQLTEGEKLQILALSSPKIQIYESENPKQILSEFVETMLKFFNDSAVIVAIGVCLAIPFYDLFIQHAQGFPYIMLYGDSQAGKTVLLHTLASIFGIINHTELTSGTSTIRVIRRGLSRYNGFPLFIDEIEHKRIEEYEDLGKDSFSGTPRKVCSKDCGENVTEINTTFCATTNHFFENMTFANFSRCILVNLHAEQFNLENFPYFSNENREKLSAILPLILSYRTEIIERYKTQFEIARKYSNRSRLCNNLAIGMSIWSVINDILEVEVVNTDNLAKEYFEYFQRYEDTELKYSDIFLSTVYRLFNEGQLVYGRDFVITRNQVLRINLSKYCDIFNSLNSKQKLNTAQLKLKIGNDSRFNFNATDLRPIGKAIKVNIADNDTLLDIKNHISANTGGEDE